MKPCFPGRPHRRADGPAIPRHSDDDDQGQNKRVPNLSGMNFQAVRSDRSSQGEAAGYLDAAATPSDLLA
jgi:hypothetical protein